MNIQGRGQDCERWDDENPADQPLKPLTVLKVYTIDHLPKLQFSAGKMWIMALMEISLDLKQTLLQAKHPAMLPAHPKGIDNACCHATKTAEELPVQHDKKLKVSVW